MYLGAGAPVTQLHYDARENLVCVVAGGYKTFELYDPLTAAALMYLDNAAFGNASPVPLDPAQRAPEYPMAQYALPSRVTLRTGDCLYLPIYWLHAVLSAPERTVSINHWRVPSRRKKDTFGRLLCGHTHRQASSRCGSSTTNTKSTDEL